MTYDLFIGERSFSSWSMRGGLMLDKFGLPYRTHIVGLYSGTMAADLADIPPARTVPAMRTPEGHVLSDSLAMAETLAERHPDAGFWPTDAGARALARSITAEMHSSFTAFRSACPNDIRQVWQGFVAPDEVLADVARIEYLWEFTRQKYGGTGPWLFGAYTLADAFFAPVACRITTYGLPVGPAAQAYVTAHLRDPAFLAWRALAMIEKHDHDPYPRDLPRRDWPR
jgi:glutathione S-transferase